MRALNIAIVGAGIAGLCAARALQLRGFRVRLFERASELRETGAGLTVSPNATHALNAIGLESTLRRIGTRPERGGVKHWRTGELLKEFARGASMQDRYGAAYYQVHRADLQDALAALVRGHRNDVIALDHEFIGLVQTSRGVQLRFANGHEEVADVVIGADGLRSTVRRALFDTPPPRFTGYVAWRGLVPAARLAGVSLDPSSCISIGPRRTFTRYFIRNGALVNYVALAEREDWREEGWSVPSDPAEVLAEFDVWHAELRAIIAATPTGVCYKWALFDREPLPTWRRGRVTLLGDAAHPMLPFLGQGAAMGIEDAMVLARAFESASTLDSALARYEEARLPRTTEVMLRSRETARAYHTADFEHYRERLHTSAESLGLLDYNPASVPV